MLLWVAAIVVAPLAIVSPIPSIRHAAVFVYAAGGIVCHQRPERSFHLHGRQLAVCARCTGLYVSALVGGLAALVLGVTSIPSWRARVWLGAAAVPTLVTVGLELARVAYPSNTIRLLSALPLGGVAAWLVIAAVAGRSTGQTSIGTGSGLAAHDS